MRIVQSPAGEETSSSARPPLDQRRKSKANPAPQRPRKNRDSPPSQPPIQLIRIPHPRPKPLPRLQNQTIDRSSSPIRCYFNMDPRIPPAAKWTILVMLEFPASGTSYGSAKTVVRFLISSKCGSAAESRRTKLRTSDCALVRGQLRKKSKPRSKPKALRPATRCLA